MTGRKYLNRLYVSLYGVIAVFLVTASYLVSQVLEVPLLHQPDRYVVIMPTTGSLFEGSAVTYRGNRIGRITRIHVGRDGMIEATATITTAVDIPRSSRVKVRSLSPVGEQYLDFQPATASGPYLKSGDRITATAKDLPETLSSTVVAISNLLDQMNPADVGRALDGISTALNGTGDDIARLADQGYGLLQTLDRYWPQSQRLADNGNVLLQVGADYARKIRIVVRSSAEITAFLRRYDPTLRSLLTAGPSEVARIRDLLALAEEVLPPFLERVNEVTALVNAYDPHFRALLAHYAKGINSLATAASDGALNGMVIVATEFQCRYGSPKHDPTSLTTHPVYTAGKCKAPADRMLRGAERAPGPVTP